MPRPLMQYRVFIGCPGGLQKERAAFRDEIARFNRDLAESEGMTFSAIGWEDTLGGQGRPQALINEDLKNCDYAVFVLHDRWGTPTGSGESSGTYEEWKLARELHKQNRIRKIFLAFKSVPKSKLQDPGDNLKPVLAFRKQIEEEKTHLFKDFGKTPEFCAELRAHLSDWYKDHRQIQDESPEGPIEVSRTFAQPTIKPEVASDKGDGKVGFDFWIKKTGTLSSKSHGDYNPAAALFCANEASKIAKSSEQIWQAKIAIGVAKFHLDDLYGSLECFQELLSSPRSTSNDEVSLIAVAHAQHNKALTLRALDRREEEISEYKKIISNFRECDDDSLRRQTAKAIVNMGTAQNKLGRFEEAIHSYEALIENYRDREDPVLKDQVSLSMLNIGMTLGELNRPDEEIEAYRRFVEIYGDETQKSYQIRIGKALFNEGMTLRALNRPEEEVEAYQRVIDRFWDAGDNTLKEIVARALINKGRTLGKLGKPYEEIECYDLIVKKYSSDSDYDIKCRVAEALNNKSVSLELLKDIAESQKTNKQLLSMFGGEREEPIKGYISRAKGRARRLKGH